MTWLARFIGLHCVLTSTLLNYCCCFCGCITVCEVSCKITNNMPMCDRWYIIFISCSQNDFLHCDSYAHHDLVGEKIRWLLSTMAVEIGLLCIGYQQQIATMIKMLMTAKPSVGNGPGQHPLILCNARWVSLIRNRFGCNTSCVVAWHCREEWWPHCMDCFSGLSCDVEQRMLKGEGAAPTKGGSLTEVDAPLDLLINIVSRPDLYHQQKSTEDHTLNNVSNVCGSCFSS